MNSGQHADGELASFDPVFVNSRREAIFITSVWLCALLWAVPCCYLMGYSREFDPAAFTTYWGVPGWIFWGVALPWLVADVVTIWFCFRMMVDDDLGETNDEAGHNSSTAAGAQS